jgi:hypothetical protein
VNSGTDCKRVRLELMAALDGEAVPTVVAARSDARQHLASCSSCGRWLQDLESMNSRFHGVSYPGAQLDLWPTVEGRLRQSDARKPVAYPLWLIGALVVGWRALQLLIDLPFPTLHPVVPLAGAIAALWLIACDPLAIETFAPELQKRGV